VYAETPEAILHDDQLLPPPGSGDERRIIAALDRDVARCGGPVRVVETSAGRGRDGERIAVRYSAPRDDARREEDDRDPDEARH
jgi:hypothetical protein